MKVSITFHWISAVVAFANPAPEAMVTAPALLPRAIRTFGWYADGVSDGSTLWNPFTYDDQTAAIGTVNSHWVDWCEDASTWCDIVTSCGGGSLYFTDAASRTPQPCDGREYKCNTDFLFESFGAPTPTLTKIECVISTWEARTYYSISPEATTTPTASSTATSTASSTEQTSATSSGSSNSTPSPTPTSAIPEDAKVKAVNTGVIAGSVVGGVVALGAIALAALYIIRRTRRKHAADAGAPTEVAATPLPYGTYGAQSADKGDRYAYEAGPGYAAIPSAPVEVNGSSPQPAVELPGTRG